MNEPKRYSSLKIGLLLVALSYFLFTFHALFTLSWIGEWESVGGGSGLISFWIFVTDISASIGLVFRFIAGLIAVAAVIFYFAKKGLSMQTTFKVLRCVLVLEAIYWLGLLVSGIWGVLPVELGGFGSGGAGLQFNTVLLVTTGVPCLVAAIAIPIALLKLASMLKENKQRADAIKWGLIAGTVYIFVFWLSNTGMWVSTLLSKGTEYIGAYPQNLLSFVLTVYGLPALGVFAAHFTGKSIGTETFEKLNLRTLGVIVVALGLYFLWNYLTWIFFGGNNLWSDWYAWFLGHNLDLWLLSLPLVGMPLLFKRQAA
ncbi:hypothetical protein G4O51_04100 [Candidatus Bathyarchaeota archaeon A05DMB-2]|jgi:hypothetical protein|nr:hypothetical protein [Candidatus Bathyarchaeota archaeon A05DMB-2]